MSDIGKCYRCGKVLTVIHRAVLGTGGLVSMCEECAENFAGLLSVRVKENLASSVVEKQKLEVAADNLELSDINISEMIADQIVRARTEATKRNIEANTILISEKLAYSELRQNGFTIPMILGMKCKYTAELPNDALFALVEVSEPPMGLKELEAENKLLREKLREINDVINGVS